MLVTEVVCRVMVRQTGSLDRSACYRRSCDGNATWYQKLHEWFYFRSGMNLYLYLSYIDSVLVLISESCEGDAYLHIH